MEKKSTFKYVFWVLLAVMFLLLITLFLRSYQDIFNSGHNNMPYLLLPIILILPAYVVLVGTLVYKDASKRGMDPWLWMTVAVFVPNLIGLIIYLIVRMSVKNTCTNCGKGLQKGFKICPYCGQNQEILCENCKKTAAPGWNVCPYCSHPLHPSENDHS